MADLRIELGATDGYQYLGIQPPLTEDQLEALQTASADNAHIPTRFPERRPARGQSYSETGFTTEVGRDDKDLHMVAHEVARVLRDTGHTVSVNGQIQAIGDGYHLFGGEDETLV